MPLKYYPATRIRPNLYTRGDEFTTPDGKTYAGKYYLTYENKAYTGINPVLGTNEELTAIETVADSVSSNSTNGITSNSNTNRIYLASSTQNTQKKVKESDVTLSQLDTYFPVPLDSDYARGYFTRYFAKSASGPQFITEISPMDYSQLQNGNVSPTILGYQSTSMLWQLTGPLNNTRVSQYQVKGGVFDTNKRVTEAKQVGFRGIVEFIGGDYVKFAQITSGSVAISGSR
jgi:hypothetical protein